MRLLAIESSADETAVCIMDAKGGIGDAEFTILGNALFSQASIHAQYGGIYPAMAKRNHALNLPPLLQAALSEADLLREDPQPLPEEKVKLIERLLKREPEMAALLIDLLSRIERPQLDAIAVTTGPGLEPALWVGVNAAKTLSLVWNLPLIQTNHIEGHLISPLAKPIDDRTYRMKDVQFPVLGLIISGGHTEFIRMDDWHAYEYLGRTRDDALGEAYDKVARMLGLPYPGGKEVSALAMKARAEGLEAPFEFPRPMMKSGDFDFSFSGLKTAVMYQLKEWKKEHGEEITDETRKLFALEFTNAVFDVIVYKVHQALNDTQAKTLVIGGGVSADRTMRKVLTQLIERNHEGVTFAASEPELSTDNAIMIGMAGAFRVRNALRAEGEHEGVVAQGNMKLT